MPGIGVGPGTVFRHDILANRPVAEPSLQGYCFFATDDGGGTLYQCDGTTWIAITGGLRTIVAGTGISVVNNPGSTTISTNLPIATSSTLGAIKVGSGLFIDANGVLSATYTLPVASASILGGVKIGANVSITGDGTISVAAPYTLPIASPSVLGGIKVGTGLSIDGGGVLSSTGSSEGVAHGGSLVGTRPTINFIDGSNVTLTVADNSGSNRVDVTVASTGGGSTLTLYQQVVMADTPKAFWPLTEQGVETTDTYQDITGNGYDVHLYYGKTYHDANAIGYVAHTPGITPGTTAPFFGDSNFNGTSDALWTSNTLGLPVNNQAYTIEGWLQADLKYFSSYMGWIAWGPQPAAGNNTAPYAIGSEFRSKHGYPKSSDRFPDILIDTYITQNQGSATINGPYMHDGEWHHVVLTDDAAGTIKIYFDGVLKSTTSTGTQNGLVYNVGNKLFLGDPGRDISSIQHGIFQEVYVGSMSHMAIYDHVLTSDQVAKHYDTAINTGLEKIPYCKVFTTGINDGGAITVANTTYTALPFAAIEFDMGTQVVQHDCFTNPERITCRVAGIYLVEAQFISTPQTAGGELRVLLCRNPNPPGTFSGDGLICEENELNWTVGKTTWISLSGTVQLFEGDYIMFEVWQNTGISQALDSVKFDVTTNCSMSIRLLSKTEPRTKGKPVSWT